MKTTLANRAHMCREDFLAMSVSMAKVAASLRRRFDIQVTLESGRTVPAAQSDAYDRKFAEYLGRSKERWLKQEAQLGRRHADYDSFLKSVPSAKRPDVENRTTIRAWSAASGPFLEALCLLADVAKTTSARTVTPVPLFRLFVPCGPIEVFTAGKSQFIWVQPTIVARRSRLNACPDILVTRQPTTRHADIVGIRDCKCHRRLPSDELRKERGKASDLMVVLCRMFNFALDREWIEANPASRIPEPGEEKSRDRVLSDEELRELWPALDRLAAEVEDKPDEAAQTLRRAKARVTPATAHAFQVQLLTAQRPGETQKMRWADVDLESGWWTIPATVAKNKLAHRVPLTKPVIEILQRRRELGGENAKVVFENRRGAGSIAHRAKKAASTLCRGLSFEFRAHDLRRTASTRMAEAGVPRDHIAKVLNHVEGGPAATRIYDRYAYDKEKRDALERWARRLQAIVGGRSGKIFSIVR
jgi:integrase